ncbi:alpha/beta hydrolase family protein [Planctomicrobium sp. SH661]|uniref:alpha/beta hydrolase family protein n=1 Tax=Planctomicrobium sp. SH661 TaxID=3448124 RepID=UPI003F5B95B8
MVRGICVTISCLMLAAAFGDCSEEVPKSASGQVTLPPLVEVEVISTLDQTPQHSLIWAPESALTEPRPLLVFLHSWSSDFKQDNSAWQLEAVKRDWLYLHPDFRGPNFNAAAGGSDLAQQDILDAVQWLKQKYKVDPNRIYLAGTSGGGHMTLLMAGRHPDRFSAASAWVPISDLVEWYRFHSPDGQPDNYATNIVQMCGGVPGASVEVERQYRDRSPLTWLSNVGDLPLDINAGIHDGHTGSVPVAHSLRAFNVVAAAHQSPQISDQEIEELGANRKLSHPQPDDTSFDPAYQKEIVLRRRAGAARVSLFDGGHEGLPAAACAWLEKQSRKISE